MRVSRLYAALLVLNVAGFPMVALMADSFGVLSTPYSITIRALMLCLSVTLLVLAVMRRHAVLPKGFFLSVFLIFWVFYGLRLLYETSFRSNLLARAPEEYWIFAIGACFIPALGLLVRVKSEAFQIAYRWSFILLFFSAVLALFSGKTVHLSSSGELNDIGRFHTESINPKIGRAHV